MFRVDNLTFSYRHRQETHSVFQNASFLLPPVGLFFVSAPIGTGKSTLIQIIAGVIKRQEGTITYDERPRFVASYMPQHPTFIEHLSLKENAMIPKKFFRLKPEEQDALHDRFLRLELHGISHTKTAWLSGGERQRLSLLQTLTKPADIYLLDEPTVALDARLKVRAFEMIESVAARHLVLFVTHEISWLTQGRPTLIIRDQKIILNGIHPSYQPPMKHRNKTSPSRIKNIRKFFLMPRLAFFSHVLTGFILSAFVMLLSAYQWMGDDFRASHFKTFRDYNIMELFITTSEPVEGSGFFLTIYRGMQPVERERFSTMVSGASWVRSFAGWLPATYVYGNRSFVLKPYLDTPADELIFFSNVDGLTYLNELNLTIESLGVLEVPAVIRFDTHQHVLSNQPTLYYPYFSMQRWLRLQPLERIGTSYYDAWLQQSLPAYHLVMEGSPRQVIRNVMPLLEDAGLSISSDAIKEIVFLEQMGTIGSLIGSIGLIILIFSDVIIGIFWMRHWFDKNKGFILWHQRYFNEVGHLKSLLKRGALTAQGPKIIFLFLLIHVSVAILGLYLAAPIGPTLALILSLSMAATYIIAFLAQFSWVYRNMRHD